MTMAESTELQTKFCSNCKKDISTANFVMHEVHCRRHILLCEHCEEPIPRGEIEQHFQDQHVKVPCGKCGQGVEKCHIERHEENDCPKKPLKCLYCELEFPKNELTLHLDYCGSRTEQCVKCSQFIMLKDQIRHEDSNCTIPIPKPSNGSGTSVTFNNGQSYLGGFDIPPIISNHGNWTNSSPEDEALFGPVEEYFNPFAFEEMTRLLNNQADAETRLSGQIGLPHQTRRVNVNTNSRPRNLNRRNEYVPPKPSNVDSSATRRTRHKPDVNRQRDTGVSSPGAAEDTTNDMDHLLALHLAQDLNQPGHFSYHDTINTYEEEPIPSSVLSTSPLSPGYHDYMRGGRGGVDIHPALLGPDEPEEALIPCEFCGDALPAEIIIQHQSGCNDSPPTYSATEDAVLFGNSLSDPEQLYSQGSDEIGRDIPPEPGINSARLTTMHHTPSDIPIVDNLSHAAVQDWISSSLPSETVTVEREDTMLPCEFCGALLPLDYLVQHQAVCDADGSGTPRGQSPAVLPLSSQPKQKNTNVLRSPNTGRSTNQSIPSSTRPHRRQRDPIEQVTEGNIDVVTEDHSERSGRTANHGPANTRLARARQTKNVNQCNNTSETLSMSGSIGATGVANIRKTLSKYGASSGRDDSKYAAQPAARTRRRLSAEALADHAMETTGVSPTRTRSNSLTKSHQILESFLNEEEDEVQSSATGTGPSIPVSKKAVKQNDNRAKQTATKKVPGTVRPTAASVRHTAVSAREVNREPYDPPTRLQGTAPPRNIRPVHDSRVGQGVNSTNTEGRPPRRSGNRVFAGQQKRSSTNKRN